MATSRRHSGVGGGVVWGPEEGGDDKEEGETAGDQEGNGGGVARGLTVLSQFVQFHFGGAGILDGLLGVGGAESNIGGGLVSLEPEPAEIQFGLGGVEA